MNIAVVTARSDSNRLPEKVLVDLGGQPNLLRLIERLKNCKKIDHVIVAIPQGDIRLQLFCVENKLTFMMGSKEDVLARVIEAAQVFTVDMDPAERVNVLRLTADCPFISWELIDRAFDLFKNFPAADTARLWGLGERVPVYGSGEFPVSLKCLERMNERLVMDSIAKSDEGLEIKIQQAREHVTSDIDADRLKYQVIYPNPPRRFVETFYRPYRLELDTEEDLALVRKIISELGINPPLQQVVRYLDANPLVAQINAGIMEKTGPSMYSLEQRARWKSQQSINTVEWRGDWAWLNDVPEIPKDAKPLYCSKGIDYLGYVKKKNGVHVLHTKEGNEITGLATLGCECKAGRTWRPG